MKTVYEWTTNTPFIFGFTFESVKNLFHFSKRVPWILDSRVKFKEESFMTPDDNYRLYVYLKNSTKTKEFLINLNNFTEKELKSPFLFRRRAIKLYGLKPGWLVIENGI